MISRSQGRIEWWMSVDRSEHRILDPQRDYSTNVLSIGILRMVPARPCISAKGKWSKHLHALAWAENAEIARTVDLSLKNCMIEWEEGDDEGFWMHRAMSCTMPTRLAWISYLRRAAQTICVQTARKRE